MTDVITAEYSEYFSTVLNKDPGDSESALWDSDED
jgi:hypothetical protein